VLNGFLVVLICFGWRLQLGLELSRANLPGLAILIAALITSGLWLLMGSISLMSLNVAFVTNTMFFVLLIFTGANLPFDRMPAWMQAFAKVLPLRSGC
jgi:ABC-type multidrug transport system permease subunit